jgi:methyl-accepting chemotaxis protein
MQTEAPTPGVARPTGPLRPGPARRLRVGLSLKVVIIAAASTALVTLILAVSFVRETRTMLEQELTSRGRLVALSLANTSASLIFAQDTTGLETLAAASLADVPGAAYLVIRDEGGRVLASAAQPSLGEARPEATDLSNLELGSRLVERTIRVAGKEMLHIVGLITFKAKAQAQYLDPLGLGSPGGASASDAKLLGSVEIGFSRADLLGQIADASRRSVGLAALAFLACLAVVFPVARLTTRPLAELSRASLGIAQGDLRQQVRRSGNDEVADLGQNFGHMVAELQALLSDLKDSAGALAQESSAMLGAATRQSEMASQQSASVAQMNASIREIAQTSASSIELADRVIAVTQTAEESSRAGEGIVEEAVASTTQVEQHVSVIGGTLGDLSGRASEIGSIIAKVKDLALRSNVLALNAAIQAARSGETGASFSVIAREMRVLAEQSSGTAGEVPKLLGQIVEGTQAATAATQQGSERARSTAALARRAGSTIGNLASVCRESATAARQIADSARQQATGVNEIVAALAQLGHTADGAVESSEQMRQVAQRLQSVSGRLTSLTERYRS